MEKYTIECYVCNQVFTAKKNMYTHIRKKHILEPPDNKCDKMESKLSCDYCASKLSNKFSLSRHVAKFHTEVNKDHNYGEVSSKKSRLICPCDNCDKDFRTNFELRAHLKSNHHIDIELEEFTFSSVAEFDTWKIETQRQTLSSYTADSAVKSLINGDKRQYYNCYRSHKFISKSQNKRSMKSMGSNKINKTCPSRIEMTVSENDCKVHVKFWKTHCGHSTQIGRIALDKEIRAQIAGKLAEGVTMDHLLDSIRDAPNEDNQRLLLVKRKDMHNIIRDFKIDFKTQNAKANAHDIKTKLDIIKGTLSSDLRITEEEAKIVNKKLDDILQILNKKNQLEELKKNILKNVTKQPRLQVKKRSSLFYT